jgi:hypothetical protein
MSEDELWERAAACVQASEVTQDPKMRSVLTCLGNFWLCLIHTPCAMDDDMALTIAEVARVQVELIGRRPTFH